MQKLQSISSAQVMDLFRILLHFTSFPGSQRIYIVE